MTEIIIGIIVSIVCAGCLSSPKESVPFYLKKDALVTIPREGFSNSPRGTVSSTGEEYLSEENIGVPVIPSGRVVKDSVIKGWNSISFTIVVPLPLLTVTGFYENRLRQKGAVSTGPYGRQYTISFTKGSHKVIDGYTYAIKDPPKGSVKRTNLVIHTRENYPNQTAIEVVHSVY